MYVRERLPTLTGPQPRRVRPEVADDAGALHASLPAPLAQHCNAASGQGAALRTDR